jgi:ketosteroid isomerase-like protein
MTAGWAKNLTDYERLLVLSLSRFRLASSWPRGRVTNGRHYENQYCVIFDMPCDKIEEMRFYTDFAKVVAAFRS